MNDEQITEKVARLLGWSGWRSKHGYWNIETPDGTRKIACEGWPKYNSDTGKNVRQPTFFDALCRCDFFPFEDSQIAFDLLIKLNLCLSVEADKFNIKCRFSNVRGIGEVFNHPEDFKLRQCQVRAAILKLAATFDVPDKT